MLVSGVSTFVPDFRGAPKEESVKPLVSDEARLEVGELPILGMDNQRYLSVENMADHRSALEYASDIFSISKDLFVHNPLLVGGLAMTGLVIGAQLTSAAMLVSVASQFSTLMSVARYSSTAFSVVPIAKDLYQGNYRNACETGLGTFGFLGLSYGLNYMIQLGAGSTGLLGGLSRFLPQFMMRSGQVGLIRSNASLCSSFYNRLKTGDDEKDLAQKQLKNDLSSAYDYKTWIAGALWACIDMTGSTEFLLDEVSARINGRRLTVDSCSNQRQETADASVGKVSDSNQVVSTEQSKLTSCVKTTQDHLTDLTRSVDAEVTAPRQAFSAVEDKIPKEFQTFQSSGRSIISRSYNEVSDLSTSVHDKLEVYENDFLATSASEVTDPIAELGKSDPLTFCGRTHEPFVSSQIEAACDDLADTRRGIRRVVSSAVNDVATNIADMYSIEPKVLNVGTSLVDSFSDSFNINGTAVSTIVQDDIYGFSEYYPLPPSSTQATDSLGTYFSFVSDYFKLNELVSIARGVNDEGRAFWFAEKSCVNASEVSADIGNFQTQLEGLRSFKQSEELKQANREATQTILGGFKIGVGVVSWVINGLILCKNRNAKVLRLTDVSQHRARLKEQNVQMVLNLLKRGAIDLRSIPSELRDGEFTDGRLGADITLESRRPTVPGRRGLSYRSWIEDDFLSLNYHRIQFTDDFIEKRLSDVSKFKSEAKFSYRSSNEASSSTEKLRCRDLADKKLKLAKAAEDIDIVSKKAMDRWLTWFNEGYVTYAGGDVPHLTELNEVKRRIFDTLFEQGRRRDVSDIKFKKDADRQAFLRDSAVAASGITDVLLKKYSDLVESDTIRLPIGLNAELVRARRENRIAVRHLLRRWRDDALRKRELEIHMSCGSRFYASLPGTRYFKGINSKIKYRPDLASRGVEPSNVFDSKPSSSCCSRSNARSRGDARSRARARAEDSRHRRPARVSTTGPAVLTAASVSVELTGSSWVRNPMRAVADKE